MTNFFCQPGGGAVGGDVRVPGDKAISHRVLLLGSIAEGPTHVRGFLESADCLVLQTALRQLGVSFTRQAGKLVIMGVGAEGLRPSSRPLDLGNSAGAIRLLMGLLAGQSFNSTLTGDAGLMRRSMDRIAIPLRLMNADVTTTNGFPPVTIRGGHSLRAVEYEMPMGPLGSFMDKVKLKKIAERGMENGLYRVKALLEGTGSIPVYITLDAYRHILKEKEKLNCSVSEAIVKIIAQNQQTVKA